MGFAEKISNFVNDALGLTDGAFGVDGTEMLIQIGSTILLFLVVRFFFWNKVTDYLEGRKEAMKQEYLEAQTASLEAAKHKETAAAELIDIRKGAKDVFDEAKERGEVERKVILEKARDEANKLVNDAHVEIESQVEKARSSINEEIVSVATLMAEKIIEKELDDKEHKDMIKKISKEVLN